MPGAAPQQRYTGGKALGLTGVREFLFSPSPYREDEGQQGLPLSGGYRSVGGKKITNLMTFVRVCVCPEPASPLCVYEETWSKPDVYQSCVPTKLPNNSTSAEKKYITSPV